jgi:tRNA(fMet)-specific endonuclease VapC
MKVMLDTDICIYLTKRRLPSILNRLAEYRVGDVGISVVTLAELEYGVSKSTDPERNQQALNEFLLPLEIAPFDRSACSYYGRIRTALERKGSPIGSMDLLIAAHALSLSILLVTNNEKEFRRVPGLRVENWT